MIHEAQGKCNDILPMPLATQKFFPGREQILYGYDILITMKELSLSLD